MNKNNNYNIVKQSDNSNNVVINLWVGWAYWFCDYTNIK